MSDAPVRPIRTEADYDAALVEVEAYFDNEPAPGTPEADRFELLVMVIERYEERHYPIDTPDPVEAIKEVMRNRGLGQKDLADVLGSEPRASEILSGRRQLSMEHIRRLHAAWKVPLELLVGPGKAA